jgi:hypothetical protein
MGALDASDAEQTLAAAMAQEDAARQGGAPFTAIDPVWRAKAARRAPQAVAGEEAVLHVLDVPEFAPLVAASRGRPGVQVAAPQAGYWRIASREALVFERKALGFVPALWNAALTGGFAGEVARFDRDRLEIRPGRPA